MIFGRSRRLHVTADALREQLERERGMADAEIARLSSVVDDKLSHLTELLNDLEEWLRDTHPADA